MSLIALCIMDAMSNETTDIKVFTTKELAINYVISQEGPFLDDPAMISEVISELSETGVVYAHDQPTQSSYALYPTHLIQ